MLNIKKLLLVIVVLVPYSSLASSDLVEVNIYGVPKAVLQPSVIEREIPFTIKGRRPIITGNRLNINKLYEPVVYYDRQQYDRLVGRKKRALSKFVFYILRDKGLALQANKMIVKYRPRMITPTYLHDGEYEGDYITYSLGEISDEAPCLVVVDGPLSFRGQQLYSFIEANL